MSPIFFIIIPIYNVESYLSECLDSILAQTYIHFEAILINDGSIDSSLKIAQEYVEKDKRFTLVSQENQGQSVARNKGLEIAKEKWKNLDACQQDKSYICFVDSDDYWEKDALEIFTKIIEQNAESNIEMIMTDSYFKVKSQSKILRENICFKPNQFKEINDRIISTSTLLEHNSGIFNLVWIAIFQANFLFASKITFIQHIFHEDNAFMTEILLNKSQSIYINPKPFYNYRFNENSTVTLKNKSHLQKRIFSYLQVIKHTENLLENIDSSLYQNYIQTLFPFCLKEIMSLLAKTGYSKDLGISKQDLLPYAHYLNKKTGFWLNFPRLYGIIKFPKRLRKSLMNKKGE